MSPRMYANCWHLNEHESAAMWNRYSRDAAPIAIQSTFKRLRYSLSNDINIGLINYIDYEKESVPSSNYFNYFLHKRKCFEYECELRALIWTVNKNKKWEISPEKVGINVPVGID